MEQKPMRDISMFMPTKPEVIQQDEPESGEAKELDTSEEQPSTEEVEDSQEEAPEEDSEETEEEEPEDEISATEKRRRDQQARADKLDHRNQLLESTISQLNNEIAEIKNTILSNQQQVQDSEDYAFLDKMEAGQFVTAEDMIKFRKAEAKKKTTPVPTKNPHDQTKFNNWLARQPDINDLNKFVEENRTLVNDYLNDAETQDQYAGVHALRTMMLSQKMKDLQEKLETKEKAQKKKKKKRKEPLYPSGSSGASHSSGRSGKKIDGGIWDRPWNRAR